MNNLLVCARFVGYGLVAGGITYLGQRNSWAPYKWTSAQHALLFTLFESAIAFKMEQTINKNRSLLTRKLISHVTAASLAVAISALALRNGVTSSLLTPACIVSYAGLSLIGECIPPVVVAYRKMYPKSSP